MQSALDFIQTFRQDEALQKQFLEVTPQPSLADMVHLGAQAEFSFSEGELRRAYQLEWSMRWMLFTNSEAEIEKD